ncbi:MAG: hypothetical protein P4L53_27530 [Candidatus Obscuribacterales bacterium]|nr:hypothetical protein [Candidatus Obscuribacterales bacterium]
MFDTNIKISVVSAAGVGNELLLKPRGSKRLQFTGTTKQKNLRKELAKNFKDYDAVLTEKSWTVLIFLLRAEHPVTLNALKELVYPHETSNHSLSEEFRYRLEWLTQLGLLERTSSEYEISTVGKALLDVAQSQESSACASARHLASAQKSLLQGASST